MHSISNKSPYFHSMTFYGFSIFFPVSVNVANIITKKLKKATHCMERMISSENIFKLSKTRKTTRTLDSKSINFSISLKQVWKTLKQIH